MRFMQKVVALRLCRASCKYISSMDLEPGREGGTWLGLSTTGKFSVLLNILAVQAKDKRGRGSLVRDFICGSDSCTEYMDKIAPEKSHYNPFQLVTIDLSESPGKIHYHKNVNSTDEHSVFPPGVYSFDNSDDLDHLWRKTMDGQERFTSIVSDLGQVSQKDTLVDSICDMLNDKTQHFPDEQLKKQFQSIERVAEGEIIQQRSARYVFSPLIKYGTRTNTVILVDFHGNCDYIERTLETPVNVDGPEWTSVKYNIQLPTTKSSPQQFA